MDIRYTKKIFLIINKYIPWVIAFSYLVGTVLLSFGLNVTLISELMGVSPIPLLVMISSSFALGFCVYHRIPLYYVVLIDLINLIDWIYVIPISTMWMITIYSGLFGITVLLSAYIKNRLNVKKRNLKENIV